MESFSLQEEEKKRKPTNPLFPSSCNSSHFIKKLRKGTLKTHARVYSLSLSNPFVFARTRTGWIERARERLKAPFAFGSSALLSLRFFIFFFLVCAEKTIASFCLERERNVLRDEDECVLFDEMRRYERADATVFVSLWTYSLRILWSFPGVVVFCAHRRRDDGRAILVLREKTFLGLCVCKCLLQQKT